MMASTRLLMAGAAFTLIVSTPAAAQYSGFWDTNQGAMRIAQEGDRAHGDYDLKGGRFHGDVEHGVLTGIWAQEYSNRRCFEERMGTHYWGRFRVHLNDAEDGFYGHWSYCEDEPGSGGEWRGHRVRERHWHNWDHW